MACSYGCGGNSERDLSLYCCPIFLLSSFSFLIFVYRYSIVLYRVVSIPPSTTKNYIYIYIYLREEISKSREIHNSFFFFRRSPSALLVRVPSTGKEKKERGKTRVARRHRKCFLFPLFLATVGCGWLAFRQFVRSFVRC